MLSFLKYLLKVILLVFLLLVILDFSYSSIFQNSIPRSKIQNILQLENKHYTFAFFGSSRTENHIDCELIEEITGKTCINFGVSGASIKDMLIVMKLAKKNNVTFDKVFMQLDYNYNGRGLSPNFKVYLVPFINNATVRKELSDDKKVFFYNYIPFYRYMVFEKVVGIREVISSLLKRKPNFNLDIGFVPQKGEGLNISGTLPSKINDENKELQEMSKLYTNSDTDIHFFISPYCQYIENSSFFDSLKLKMPQIHNYARTFDNNEQYFANCGHLNSKGARYFTEILIDDFKLNN